MYAITGVTGKVGGALARALLAAGQPVRAVMRDAHRGAHWATRGCEIALAGMDNAAALTEAFTGASAAFVLLPPLFDPQPGYPESRAIIASITAALTAARPEKVVCLSTVGADAGQDNLLSQLTLLERALRGLPLPLTFLRPAWFIDNIAWDIEPASRTGVMQSFLQPLDRALPMVAARDVGRVAAELIQERWTDTRVVELEGPALLSPNDLAATLGQELRRPVRPVAVPRETWEALLRSQGMMHPGPRMRMLDGFNEGWIAFPDGGRHTLKGQTTAAEVIAGLLDR